MTGAAQGGAAKLGARQRRENERLAAGIVCRWTNRRRRPRRACICECRADPGCEADGLEPVLRAAGRRVAAVCLLLPVPSIGSGPPWPSPGPRMGGSGPVVEASAVECWSAYGSAYAQHVRLRLSKAQGMTPPVTARG